MDIARPDLRSRRRRRQIAVLAAVVVALLAASFGVNRLKPAVPEVERAIVWTDTVRRGPMLRQVRGLGMLVPSQEFIRQIPAESEATVVRIRMLPGSEVRADSILLEMSNFQLEQEALNAHLELKAAEAQTQSLRVKLESDFMSQRASAATVAADYRLAQLQSETDKALFELDVISRIAYKTSKGKADELAIRNELENERLAANERAIASQMAEQQARVEQVRALAELKRRQLEALRVRAGIDGVLVELPLQVGQRVTPGAMLAKVVQPNHLIAELKIHETQARDVQIGQAASIDTHSGLVAGTVMRVDPGVQNGTVTVDVRLTADLPKGARPDLSVEGTIDLERLDNVLFVGRPAFGQESTTISLFRMDASGRSASRTHLRVGRASVNAIQVIDGLQEGDTVVLSDMSRWDNYDRIRLTN